MSARRRLLVIKTSSLGDVVHALPAISDIADIGQWEIDWVCEDAFADIPALHPAVGRVIPCAIRRWRRTWTTAPGRAEMAAFRRSLQSTRYDVVLDLQGLIKSALVVRVARGDRHGYAWNSAREPLATLAYDHKHVVAWGQHAIARNRQLTSATLATSIAAPPRFGLKIEAYPDAADPFVVALHATSRADKLWPEENWRRLLTRLSGDGVRAVLPWGNDVERARSLRIALGIAGASVPERMDPGALAALFARSAAVAGVDTGLLHLATAVGTPSAAIFVATDPALTGVVGERSPAVNLGGNGSTPNVESVWQAIAPWLGSAATSPAGAG